ncbi:MAG: T9SS type A sorting domain-containing protein [Bacteroidia bacterium]|nr:T9SS type A sorting domain-containing protein [Bacteroidia bacterium]MDW8348281.1 T9SS type A sorting domain-containing protein [Bacteroidia bacterium]
MKVCFYFTFTVLACITSLWSQSIFSLNNTIPVQHGSTLLTHPWMGGLNAPQFSEIDLNNDGFMDLFVFERANNKIHTYLNNGIIGTVSYTYAPQYISNFPQASDYNPSKSGTWALLRDYNYDSKPDLFLGMPGSVWVFKNISTPTSIEFTLFKKPLKATYTSATANLYVAQNDLPDIIDVDNDGDLDVMSWDVLGIGIYWFKNKSQELYGHADSLAFDAIGCWGNISEDGTETPMLGYFGSGCPIYLSKTERIQHAGSTLTLIDFDNDGDKDILVGGPGIPTLWSATNGGTASSANFVSYTLSYPSTNPYNVPIFPAAYYLDVNNDNKKDLIVATNEMAMNAITDTKSSIWVYLNTGTSSAPIFNTLPITAWLQSDMIDVGNNAIPTFFDYNADGLEDIIIANEGEVSSSGNLMLGNLTLYKNIGTATSPSYQKITDNYANVKNDTLRGIAATFGDIDGDGDKDMVIGDQTGKFHYYQNVAGAGNPAVFAPVVKNAFGGIDVGSFATPLLYDMDSDGKLDLIAGNQNGKIFYYHNKGTITSPNFVLEDSFFGEVDVRRYGYGSSAFAVPCIVDLNKNNNYDLLVGSQSGYLYYYPDVQGLVSSTYVHTKFTLQDSSFQNIEHGLRCAPAKTDWNNDGYDDIALGLVTGGLKMYQNNGVLSTEFLQFLPFNKIQFYPNPAQNLIHIEFTAYPIKEYFIRITDITGKTLKSISVQNDVKQYSVDVDDLENGLYIIEYQGQVQKLIIQR